MHSRLLEISWILALLGCASVAVAADGPISLPQAEQMALQHSPALAMYGAAAEAKAALPAQAGALPDPVLSVGALNVPAGSYSLRQEPMTQTQIGLSQRIPFPGKLGLREEAAEFEAAGARLESDEAALRLLRDVRTAWWNLFYLDRALETVQRSRSLLRQLLKVAEAKYKTGQGLQQDVLLAQLEQSRLIEAESALTGSRKIQAARFNALLGQPGDAPAMLPSEMDEVLPEPKSEAALLRMAQESRPLLSAKQQGIKAAEARTALAEKDGYPDFTFGAAYGQRRGYNLDGTRRANLASVQLSMTLPLFSGSRQDAALAESRAEQAKAEYRLADEKLRVDAEVSEALADYSRAREQAELFKSGIIPQATQTVSSMLAGFQVGKVDFLNLMRAQLTLYNYETQYWKVLAEAKQADARLIAAVGKEFSHEQ